MGRFTQVVRGQRHRSLCAFSPCRSRRNLCARIYSSVQKSLGVSNKGCTAVSRSLRSCSCSSVCSSSSRPSYPRNRSRSIFRIHCPSTMVWPSRSRDLTESRSRTCGPWRVYTNGVSCSRIVPRCASSTHALYILQHQRLTVRLNSERRWTDRPPVRSRQHGRTARAAPDTFFSRSTCAVEQPMIVAPIERLDESRLVLPLAHGV